MRLNNKVVVITGSSSGIGQATALRFAKDGAKIVVNCKSNTQGAEAVVNQIEKLGGEAIQVTGDVSNPKDVEKLFQRTLAKFKTIDILINNAGSSHGKEFLDTTKEDWLEVFDNNFFGTVLCSQIAVRIMSKNGGGKILNTASIRGLTNTGREGIMPYSAAKAAVVNFTKTLAKEVSPKILVNAVAPGFVYTSYFETIPKELKDQFIANTLIKRFITVDEIADAFHYLATTDAVTGSVLIVDGGFTLKRDK